MSPWSVSELLLYLVSCTWLHCAWNDWSSFFIFMTIWATWCMNLTSFTWSGSLQYTAYILHTVMGTTTKNEASGAHNEDNAQCCYHNMSELYDSALIWHARHNMLSLCLNHWRNPFHSSLVFVIKVVTCRCMSQGWGSSKVFWRNISRSDVMWLAQIGLLLCMEVHQRLAEASWKLVMD